MGMTKMAADELGHHKQQGGLVVRDSRINIIYLSPQQPFQQPAAVYNPRNQAEHSLELHAPSFIASAMGARPFKLVPIMVGALSTDA